MQIRRTSVINGIPLTILIDWLYGKTTSRKRHWEGMLTIVEESLIEK
jgi:hypothetical protein